MAENIEQAGNTAEENTFPAENRKDTAVAGRSALSGAESPAGRAACARESVDEKYDRALRLIDSARTAEQLLTGFELLDQTRVEKKADGCGKRLDACSSALDGFLRPELAAKEKEDADRAGRKAALLKPFEDRLTGLQNEIEEKETRLQAQTELCRQLSAFDFSKPSPALPELDPVTAQLQPLREESLALYEKEKQAKEQLDSLGLFHGREKKALQGELESLRQQRDQIKEQIRAIVTPACARIQERTQAAEDSAATLTEDVQALQAELPDAQQALEQARADAQFRYLNRGDTLTFGCYPQNKDSDEAGPIEWLVLDNTDDGRLLLVSQKILDVKPYGAAVPWADSDLRAWLNGEFYSMAFSAREQAKILSAVVADEANPLHAEPAQAADRVTEDRVFLLSAGEAIRTFTVLTKPLRDAYNGITARRARACEPTGYAKVSLPADAAKYATAGWWLRSSAVVPDTVCPGDTPDELRAAVSLVGGISGAAAGSLNGVRPAIRVQF